MKQNKARQLLSNKFMEALKEDKIPWKRGWRTSQPYNAVSGNNYHGVNNLLLSFIAHEKGYSDPRWCTFKQAADNNWHINKGEKGTPIEFWSLYDSETKKKLTPAEAYKLKNELSLEDYQERVHPLSEIYTVFNAEQISKIPELTVENNLVDVKSLIEKRDVLIENMGVNFLEQGWEAYYSKDRDLLSLPPVQEFNSNYEYFAVLLHEGAHATGHEKRLNRDLSGIKGSASYAKEELRAEIASAFVSQEIGFEQTEANIDNHKAYLQSWIEVLENNPDELYAAIKDAQKISDYLIEKGEFDQVIERAKEKEVESYKRFSVTETQKDAQAYIFLARNSQGNIGVLDRVYRQEDIAEKQQEYQSLGYTIEVVSANPSGAWGEWESVDGIDGFSGDEHELLKSMNGLQQREINLGIEKGLDVSWYARPEFNSQQMQQIREGLEQGLDVQMYARTDYDFLEMEKIKKELVNTSLEAVYRSEEIYNQMTEREKEAFDVSVDCGDIKGANKIMEEKRKELEGLINTLGNMEDVLDVTFIERLTIYGEDTFAFVPKANVSIQQVRKRIEEIQHSYVCNYQFSYDNEMKNKKGQSMVVAATSSEAAFSLFMDTLSKMECKSGKNLSRFKKGENFFFCYDEEDREVARYNHIMIKNCIPAKDQPQPKLTEYKKSLVPQ